MRAAEKSRVGHRAAPNEIVSVAVVDNSPVTRRAVLRLLGKMPWIHVVGTASTRCSALTRCRAVRPALVLTGLHLPDGTGLELARDLHALLPGARVIVISKVGQEFRRVSLSAGADGFALTNRLAQELPEEIKRLFPPAGRGEPATAKAASRRHGLSGSMAEKIASP